jgi:hypothetical protein
MSAKKEEFAGTKRFEKLYSILAAVDQVEQRRQQKVILFDRILEILSLPTPDESKKIADIKTVVATYCEDENGR